MNQTLQQDALNPLVKLGYPLFKICVALEVEAIDLTEVKLLVVPHSFAHTAVWTLPNSSLNASVV